MEATVAIGEPTAIVCSSDLTDPIIMWLSGGETVVSSTSAGHQLLLMFNPVNDSIHNQQYVCKVTASDPANPATISITVTVKVQGKFTLQFCMNQQYFTVDNYFSPTVYSPRLSTNSDS